VPTAAFNNCSGKHSLPHHGGADGEPTKDYIKYNHPAAPLARS
jgi:L-asparaginase II